MRPISLAIVALAGLSATRCSVGHAVPQVQHSLPVAKPWTPPTTDIGREWLDAAIFLQAHGLGDPRGGEYKRVKLNIGNSAVGGLQTFEENGWVMPDGAFVAWDGHVYRPEAVLGKADLEADIRRAKPSPSIYPEGSSHPGNPRTPLGICLLLVAGRADLAKEALPVLLPQQKEILTEWIGSQFLASLYGRAVAAHMRGDDRQAGEDASALLALRPAFEAISTSGRPEDAKTRFAFLDPTKVLLTDSDRRLTEGTRPRPSDRIAALIQDLENVKARQMSQPGGVNLAEDPIVWDLIKEGPAAVEPILDCMETDQRLTRSVSFGRDFFPSRHLISVKSAAYAAFQGIVDAEEFRTADYKEPTVSQLRAWWQANKTKSAPERWMATLEDDKATYNQWLEAASRLTEDVSIRHIGSGATLGNPGDQAIHMKGEPARGLTNPSVTDLLTKRAIQMVGTGQILNSNQLFEAAAGARVAKMLARWDPAHSAATLAKVSDRCYEVLTSGPMAGNSNVGQHYALLENARLDLHDDSGLERYASWLSQVNPNDMFGYRLQVIAPFWNHPHDPAIVKAFERVFLSKSSQWNLGVGDANPTAAYVLQEMTPTPMMAMPEFRQLVLDLLSDERAVGEAWADKDGNSRFEIPKGASGGTGTRVKQPDPLAKDTSRKPYRVCDMVACALTRFASVPEFAPYWPQAKRDKTIATMKTLIQSKGEALAKEAPPVFSWF